MKNSGSSGEPDFVADDNWEVSTVAGIPLPAGNESAPPSDPPSFDAFHLVVFQGTSSFVFDLPLDGGVSIGRSESCALVIDDPSVSREHARLMITKGEVELVDCGSQNGTLVNGERITDVRVLISGDEISISANKIIFFSRARSPSAFRELEFPEFRRRVDVEIERALRFSRPLTLVALVLGEARPDHAKIITTLASDLRRSDLAAWDGDERILIVMPETTPEQGETAAQRMLELIRPIAVNARAGYACVPGAAGDVDALIARARGAARTARPATVDVATSSGRKVTIGARTAIVADPAMISLYELIQRLASSDLPVLILGETGTGKELAAAALHDWSARKDRPMLTLNCAAIPEALLESELFGHQKGAFTGATEAKAGLLEQSHQGTVFLDEIGDLPLAAQAKLLRVLEAKKISRVGGLTEVEIDLRIIAATHRNLEDDIKEGKFRRDLYFRLAGGLLWIPPLRERTQELPMLVESFLSEACARAKLPPKALSTRAMQALRSYPWPGNIRELRNLMEYVTAAVPGSVIELAHFGSRLRDTGTPPKRRSDHPSNKSAPDHPTQRSALESSGDLRPVEEIIRDVEKKHMLKALELTQWNQTRAAELIHMPLRTFQARLRQYGIRDPKK